MKGISLILICFLYFNAFALDASLSYASFKGSESNYIEVYLYVVGSTVTFKDGEDNMKTASLEVTIKFLENEQIKKVDKYLLNSPNVHAVTDFTDLKRYSLANGTYTLEVDIRDVLDEENTRSYSAEGIVINYEEDEVMMSDIQLLTSCLPANENSPLVKNGFIMESAPFHFYNKHLSTLYFYVEIYNTEMALNDDFVLSYQIDKLSALQNGHNYVQSYKRRKKSSVDVYLAQVDIKDFPSGNYKLHVEVLNRNKEVLCSKAVLFQRSNPSAENIPISSDDFDIENTFVEKLSHDELRYSLKAIAPKLSGDDVEVMNMVIESRNVKSMKNSLYAYWANKNSVRPKEAYEAYMEVAEAIDREFNSGLGYGFETDRGYIFMRYGKPTNLISIEDENDAPPYEIWFYDQFPFTDQTDVKFLFYNPSLAAGNYILLHSNARGEINNPQWQIELYRDAANIEIEGNYRDATEIGEGVNRNAVRYFNDY